MTLARTALRLCVSACLKGDSASRPTIAEGRVYDSRIGDLSPESFVDDAKATVILLTDSDEGQALSDQNGGPPFRRMIDLVIEFGMTLAIKDQDGYSVGYPDTDARLESSLDLLEFQIIRRLAYDPAAMPVLFRRIARIRKYDNHRQVLDDTGVKVACRILTLTCDVSDDQERIYPSDSAPTGLGLLPEPLRSVAAILPAGSAGADVCAGLIASITPLTASPLEGVDFEYDADPKHKAPRINQTVEFDQT